MSEALIHRGPTYTLTHTHTHTHRHRHRHPHPHTPQIPCRFRWSALLKIIKNEHSHAYIPPHIQQNTHCIDVCTTVFRYLGLEKILQVIRVDSLGSQLFLPMLMSGGVKQRSRAIKVTAEISMHSLRESLASLDMLAQALFSFRK